MSETRRKLRTREKRQYKDLPDNEIEEKSMFSVLEKLKCPRFEELNLVKEMKGEDLTFEYFQSNGFDTPILVKDQNNLQMKVPDPNTFTVKDIERYVGPERMIDVMDVKTQKNLEMTLNEWCKFFLNPLRSKLLNVISLEFSHTKLADYVEPPFVIKQLDWVNCVWPYFLRLQQKESTNAIQVMKYPKVQKYCLMSVKGCYTDFHIDFGGTSVWYHILRGEKIFWLIPPTPLNMELYEQWVLSGKQNHLFFGDTVEHCSRVALCSGDTFFIPSGWIHAVYTPQDSLVFGGNFLHSLGIENQIKIAQLENLTKVPIKFRYPFFNEMHWYVLQSYVQCLIGKCFLTVDNNGNKFQKDKLDDKNNDLYFTKSNWNLNEENVFLTSYENSGLKIIIKYLSKLSKSKQCIPDLITNSNALMNEAKKLVASNRLFDESKKHYSTYKPVLYWLCKINFESYLNKNLLDIKQDSSTLLNTKKIKIKDDVIINPLKTWGAGVQDVNSKFLAFKNKFNSVQNLEKQKLELNKEDDLIKQKAICDNQLNKHKKDDSNKNDLQPLLNNVSYNQHKLQTYHFGSILDNIPSSFAQLISTTEISNSGQTKVAHTLPISTNVNKTFLSQKNINNNNKILNQSSELTIVSTQTQPSLHLQTQQPIYQSPKIMVKRQTIFNGPIVASGSGIICTTNPQNLTPNLYGVQSNVEPLSINNNFNSYSLIGNNPVLTTPTGLSILTTNTIPVTFINVTTTASVTSSKSFESQLKIINTPVQTYLNKKLEYNSMIQNQNTCSTSIFKSNLTKNKKNLNQKQSNQSKSIQNSTINSEKSSITSFSQNQTQSFTNTSQIQPHFSFHSPSLIQPSIQTHEIKSSHQISSSKSNLITTAQSPILTTFANKSQVNNIIGFSDGQGSVLNFTGQHSSFISPASLNHQINQNFIITPVNSNLITGNSLIANPIYSNFISNVIPGNVLVNSNLNSALPIQTQHTTVLPQHSQTSHQQITISDLAIKVGQLTTKLNRINCRNCIPCNRTSCGLCSPCLDYFSKFGLMPPANNINFSNGQINSEICLAKKCLNPILPYIAHCFICGKNGWNNCISRPGDQQSIQLDTKCNLLECDTCNQIAHLECIHANLSVEHKANKGRINNHLTNSWTCPVCAPIKYNLAKKSSINLKNKLSLNNEILTNLKIDKNENKDLTIEKNKSIRIIKKEKQKQNDLGIFLNKKEKQSTCKPENVKLNEKDKQSTSSSVLKNKNMGRTKQLKVYDFDEHDEDSISIECNNGKQNLQLKPSDNVYFNTIKNSTKNETINASSNFTFNKSNGNNENNKFNLKMDINNSINSNNSIKLPPKKMAKIKLDNNQQKLIEDKFKDKNHITTIKYHQSVISSEQDKLLLLATTSCEKLSQEKEKNKKFKNNNKLLHQVDTLDNNKINLINKNEKNIKQNNNLNTPTSSTIPSTIPSISNANISTSLNKSRTKCMQSTRGRLEQSLKVLKKKADFRTFNQLAYKKFVTSQQFLPKASSTIKTSLSTNTSSYTTSTLTNTIVTSSISNINLNSNSTSNSKISTSNSNVTITTTSSKDNIVSNCLKNDSILYPNSKRDTKESFLNKFKNISSTICNTNNEHKLNDFKNNSNQFKSFSNDFKVNEKLQKLLKNQNDNKNITSIETSNNNSESDLCNINKNLYDCVTFNSAKLIPMSYSIEKLASSTSIINKPLEPAPPSTLYNVFENAHDTTINNKLNKFKKQIDLFPNLNSSFSSSLSNWSSAFKQQQNSPGFSYSPYSNVFGAFSRSTSFSSATNPFRLENITQSLNSTLTNKLNFTNLENQNVVQTCKQLSSTNLVDQADYYASTEDETDETILNCEQNNNINTETSKISILINEDIDQNKINDNNKQDKNKNIFNNNEKIKYNDNDDLMSELSDEQTISFSNKYLIKSTKNNIKKTKNLSKTKQLKHQQANKQLKKNKSKTFNYLTKTDIKETSIKSNKKIKTSSNNKNKDKNVEICRFSSVNNNKKRTEKNKFDDNNCGINDSDAEEKFNETLINVYNQENTLNSKKIVKNLISDKHENMSSTEDESETKSKNKITKTLSKNNKKRLSNNSYNFSNVKKAKLKQSKMNSSVKSKNSKISNKKKNSNDIPSETVGSISNVSVNKRKTEVDRLLEQSEEIKDINCVEKFIYETIVDKVKRNLGRKSKIVGAAAVNSLSLSSKQYQENKLFTCKSSNESISPSQTKKSKTKNRKVALIKKQSNKVKEQVCEDKEFEKNEDHTDLDQQVTKSRSKSKNKKKNSSSSLSNVSKNRKKLGRARK